jgi:hypothetical protein
MIKKTFLASILLLALIQSTISSPLEPYPPTQNPICPPPSTLSFNKDDASEDGDVVDFDYSGFAFNI